LPASKANQAEGTRRSGRTTVELYITVDNLVMINEDRTYVTYRTYRTYVYESQ
jgi:hypothetical protein